MLKKRRERRQLFSWQRTADLLWESIEKAPRFKNTLINRLMNVLIIGPGGRDSV
jgi:hypothetical protein